MGIISSINFKKSNPIQTKHNDRELPPNYLLNKECGAECNRNSMQANALKNQIISEAIEAYTNKTRQKFQAKSYEWSAVVNIKPETTMQDLERLAEKLQEVYKIQCYQIAIHRDEGHKDDSGNEIINHHAHLEFITLDKQTGQNMWQRRHIGVQQLRKMQDLVAQTLGMQRGIDKRASGTERIEPRKYAQMKEAERAAQRESKQEHELEKESLLTQKDILKTIEAFRKDSIGKGCPKEFFNDLSAFKSDLKGKKQKELTLDILKQALNELIEPYLILKAESQQEKSKINALEAKISHENEQGNTNIALNDFKALKRDLECFKHKIAELEQEKERIAKELKETKEQLEPYREIIEHAKSYYEAIKSELKLKIEYYYPNDKQKHIEKLYKLINEACKNPLYYLQNQEQIKQVEQKLKPYTQNKDLSR